MVSIKTKVSLHICRKGEEERSSDLLVIDVYILQYNDYDVCVCVCVCIYIFDALIAQGLKSIRTKKM